ncbi:MAG TPA: efflux RND transporter periplasmic adaptor subunit, partial [Candidatus Polarisedimenticolia bacterium]|nr:efflux RND transporter periplasmic adaptor subunit [Candidatus Polarisedimenticolia bacterium]
MKSVHGRGRIVFLSVALALLLAGAGLAGLKARKSHGTSGSAGAGPSQGAVAPAAAQGAGGDDKVSGQDGKTAVPVSVAVIATGPMSSYISSTANLVAENEVKILAEAEGRVAELGVEEGNRVGRSQVLASLAREDAEITLKKAQLRAARAKSAFDRAQKLVADNLVSREDYDKIGLDNEVAQQELAEAQWRLEKTFIRAPIGGRITERDIKLGQHVRPGDTLFTVSDFDPLIARLYLPEKDVLGLKQGREVRITLKADEQTRFQGRIRQISPVVDT